MSDHGARKPGRAGRTGAVKPPGAASPREIATYLVALRPILATATEVRRSWVKQLGSLMDEARRGNPARVAHSAAAIGHQSAPTFRACRKRLDGLRVPPPGAACQRALALWLEKLTQAADVLIEIGRSGQLGRMRETQELLADSRVHAHSFNGEYARLLAELRQRLQASARGPVGAARRAQGTRRGP